MSHAHDDTVQPRGHRDHRDRSVTRVADVPDCCSRSRGIDRARPWARAAERPRRAHEPLSHHGARARGAIARRSGPPARPCRCRAPSAWSLRALRALCGCPSCPSSRTASQSTGRRTTRSRPRRPALPARPGSLICASAAAVAVRTSPRAERRPPLALPQHLDQRLDRRQAAEDAEPVERANVDVAKRPAALEMADQVAEQRRRPSGRASSRVRPRRTRGRGAWRCRGSASASRTTLRCRTRSARARPRAGPGAPGR